MRRAITIVALAYSVFHFYWSGVRYPLADPNLAKFDEQLPPLLEHLRTGDPVHVNSPVQYGPVFFLVVHPLLHLTGGDRVSLAAALYVVQLACFGGAFLLTIATLKRVAWRGPDAEWRLVVAWLAILWLNFSPVYTTIAIKSVETWELFLVCLGVFMYLRNRVWWAAFAIAAAGLIKLLPFVFMYYWLVTDRRTFARALAATAAILAAGHLVYGSEMGLGYLFNRTGGTFGFSYGMTWHENVALKAAIAKIFGRLNVPPGYTVDLTPPQLTATILIGDLAVLALGLRLTWEWLRARAHRTIEWQLWEWSLLTIAVLVLSPNTTMEYATLAVGAASYALVRMASNSRLLTWTHWTSFAGALFFLGALVPRQVLNRLTLVDLLKEWRGYTHLTAPEAYQYFCFPLLGLVLLGWTIWKLKPAHCAEDTRRRDPSPGLKARRYVDLKGALMVAAIMSAGCSRTQGSSIDDLRRDAAQGVPRAQHQLGVAYACGAGVPRDNAAAVEWIRRAASQGLAGAEHDLSTLYLWGRGVPSNYITFVSWAEKAARHGSVGSMRRVAAAYASGTGVPVNNAEALAWYEKAARHGDSRARSLMRRPGARRDDMLNAMNAAGLYALSDSYFRGFSVPQSNSRGYYLLARAAALLLVERATVLSDPRQCLAR